MGKLLAHKTARMLLSIFVSILPIVILCVMHELEPWNGTLSSVSIPVATNGEYPLIWDESVAPNYVLSLGEAQIRGDAPEGGIVYSGLDELGRSGIAYGTITNEMRDESRGNRDPMPEGVYPSGWTHNEEVDITQPNGEIYHGYFLNRSHLIADSLGGDAIVENMVTGTRMQNVGGNDSQGGMAYTETKARDWLDSHSGTIYYSAEPIYNGSDLMPMAVEVNMLSDDGALNERVLAYNAAKGYSIDYSDGAWAKAN